mmetsp:Transcript_9079/g.15599  ORF Transcript_9079/g.15599 Transcript_9079/m.15599 type:complete len:272 (+) Transcript_9079:979-1794(+)
MGVVIEIAPPVDCTLRVSVGAVGAAARGVCLVGGMGCLSGGAWRAIPIPSASLIPLLNSPTPWIALARVGCTDRTRSGRTAGTAGGLVRVGSLSWLAPTVRSRSRSTPLSGFGLRFALGSNLVLVLAKLSLSLTVDVASLGYVSILRSLAEACAVPRGGGVCCGLLNGLLANGLEANPAFPFEEPSNGTGCALKPEFPKVGVGPRPVDPKLAGGGYRPEGGPKPPPPKAPPPVKPCLLLFGAFAEFNPAGVSPPGCRKLHLAPLAQVPFWK